MITHYNLTALIASILPWPFAVNHAADSAHVEIRDLKYPSVVLIPYPKLTSESVAAHYVTNELVTYRALLAAWHGRHNIVWS